MHGFVNVFVAAAFAWQRAQRDIVINVLNDGEAAGFQFLPGELRWRGMSIASREIRAARHDFAHSFGSCSFVEPVADLRMLGWLA
jgi:hypothetical protein